MLALVRSSDLGSAFHASKRARPCVAHSGSLRYQHVGAAAAHQDALGSGEKQPIHAIASKSYSLTKELLDAYPELYEFMKEVSKHRLDAPVHVHHKEDPSRHTTVLLREFLAASTSLPAAEDFLRRQLGIEARQKVKITYSLAEFPNDSFVTEECELDEQTLEERPMPYWVGYANGWFVSEC